jgi:hypothetical protein
MVNMEIFGYMWEIIQSIYITGLEDQSNDTSKISESSSFGVHLQELIDQSEIDKASSKAHLFPKL